MLNVLGYVGYAIRVRTEVVPVASIAITALQPQPINVHTAQTPVSPIVIQTLFASTGAVEGYFDTCQQHSDHGSQPVWSGLHASRSVCSNRNSKSRSHANQGSGGAYVGFRHCYISVSASADAYQVFQHTCRFNPGHCAGPSTVAFENSIGNGCSDCHHCTGDCRFGSQDRSFAFSDGPLVIRYDDSSNR